MIYELFPAEVEHRSILYRNDTCRRFRVFVVLLSMAAFRSAGMSQSGSPMPSISHEESSVPSQTGPTTSSSQQTLPDSPASAASNATEDNLLAPSMNAKQKFVYASENVFGASSLIFAAAGAGVNQAQDLYPEFHQGTSGYVRYYWHSYADQAVDSYVVNFLLAGALHIDPRYHALHAGHAWTRAAYAAHSLLIARTDSGQATFNTPQVLGSGVAASLSTLNYPERDRTASIVAQRWASNLAGDGLLMLLKEFSPEFKKAGGFLCSKVPYYSSFCERPDQDGQ